nr:CDP-alcohol phosphatidyltransferase family protein [Persicimonas caeni]
MSETTPESAQSPTNTLTESEKAKKRRFSMLREFSLADLITLGNASCGTASIFLALSYASEHEVGYLWVSFALLPVALILDFFDGYVARWRRAQSMLGPDLDSLSDIVSFGVAPAVLAWALGMRGGLDMAVLIFFVACGISRLARYNATAAELTEETSGKVKYYEGTPIPTSIVLVIVLVIAFSQGAVGANFWFGSVEILGMGWHPLSTMYFLSGCAMISGTLKIPKP